jgi:DNA-directed RNA polymerase beta subunit
MSYSKIHEVAEMPGLINIQTESYNWFVNDGLREVFSDISPIKSYSDRLILEFLDHKLNTPDDPPKYSQEECKERDVTYAAPLKVKARLINKETGEVKEQEVFMGDFPLMTEKGTFIYNGAERVVVTQLVRSPGPYYSTEKDKNGKEQFTAQVIPNRGAWLEYETDANGVVWVRVDRNRKIAVTTLLRALGFKSDAEIIAAFGEDYEALSRLADATERTYPSLTATFEKDVAETPDDGVKEIYKKLRPGEPPATENARAMFNSVFFERRYDLARVGRYKYNKKLGVAGRLTDMTLADDVVDPSTGEILAAAGDVVSRDKAIEIENAGVRAVRVYSPTDIRPLKERYVFEIVGSGFVSVAAHLSKKDAEAYSAARLPVKVHYPTLAGILEQKLKGDELIAELRRRRNELSPKHIHPDDILASISYILGLPHGIGSVDDIDHLGNRRVRTVGELLQNQFRIGLARMERVVRERMTIQQDVDVTTPQELINIRPVTAAVKEFFGSSQLSQFMDQNNPLAELTHKRRLSALGPGGLSRERAGFEVRDVHHSHYGRMCPIETPEGPNIGLIGSLTTYGRVNEYGFIETPYRKVDKQKGVVTEEIHYLTADDEELLVIAQANEPLDSKGAFLNKRVASRGRGGEIDLVPKERIDYMDVSPKQVVSVATAMIPFLENDDANRALMGSNMQRQAVPLLVTDAPVIGTGMEYIAARDSGVVVLAKNDGVVDYVDAEVIKIRRDDPGEPIDIEALVSELSKLETQRGKWDTEFAEKVTERKELERKRDAYERARTAAEEKIEKIDRKLEKAKKQIDTQKEKLKKAEGADEKKAINDRIAEIKENNKESDKKLKADRKAVEKELAQLVAQESEDSKDEKKIQTLGKRIATLDLSISDAVQQIAAKEREIKYAEAANDGGIDTFNLLKFKRSNQGTCINQRPIVTKGERVKKGEVIADGPSTDEGEVALGKNLLIGFMTWEGYNYEDAIILNERLVMEDVLTSLHIVEHECEARDTKLGPEEITRDIPNVGEDARKDLDEEGIVRIGAEVTSYDILVGKVTPKGETELTAEERLLRAIFGEKAREVRDTSLKLPHGETGIVVDIKTFSRDNGDELPPGVSRLVRVYVATKRKISVGDKMAGRHGNKGVISRILPEEDMPFMEDGTPLEVMLNPLGVPSRMNVGQVLEVHLGLAARHKGWYVSTPVFDGAKEEDIIELLKECGYPESGKLPIRDGRTGEYFDNAVTVGYMYMLKLHHLVDDKIHARSTGPYSLVTQQPLGGKAQFGGQRFGEMEVWALEAYGAAYTLQEILTVKSDDIVGRVKTYEAIVKGDNIPEPGIPESFKVLIKELQSLGLDVKVLSDDDEEIELKEYVDLGSSTGLERMISTDRLMPDDDDGYYKLAPDPAVDEDDDDDEDLDDEEPDEADADAAAGAQEK